MLKSACVLLAAVLVTPLASAQSMIFKCVGKNGIEAYTNSPCPPKSGSRVWIQDANAKNAQDPIDPTKRSAAPSATSNSIAVQFEPRAGLTSNEAKARWGEPTEVTQEEGVQGRVDTWSYGSRSVQFDSRGRVIQP
jgi:hypothetical protein